MSRVQEGAGTESSLSVLKIHPRPRVRRVKRLKPSGARCIDGGDRRRAGMR